MRTRIKNFYSGKVFAPRYSFQVNMPGSGWIIPLKNGRSISFKTPAERDVARKEYSMRREA